MKTTPAEQAKSATILPLDDKAYRYGYETPEPGLQLNLGKNFVTNGTPRTLGEFAEEYQAWAEVRQCPATLKKALDWNFIAVNPAQGVESLKVALFDNGGSNEELRRKEKEPTGIFSV
jgi:hypothetical protein